MKIYTKGGDAGETGLFGGERVPKDHARIRAYGTLDELNAVLGMSLSFGPVPDSLSQMLTRVQGELFMLGAELATPRGKKLNSALISSPHIENLEREIDGWQKELPPLQTFILPGGTPLSAQLHLARTISRRAERETIVLHRAEPQRPEVLAYVNRLSDALFVAARFANFKAGCPDVAWVSR
jgi:cob(I)alamin adenosyltransferase